MDAGTFQNQMNGIMQQLAQVTADTTGSIGTMCDQMMTSAHSGSFIIDALMVLMLAGFVGYYVIWNVTPALHAPLMGITNAISSVIIVGAVIAAGPAQSSFSKWLGFAGIILASVNIFGGFVVTNRMLEMFASKKKKDVK